MNKYRVEYADDEEDDDGLLIREEEAAPYPDMAAELKTIRSLMKWNVQH